MKLTVLILLVSAPLLFCSTLYTVKGSIPMNGNKYFTPSYDGPYCAYEINMLNYPVGYGFYFQLSIYDGTFDNGNIYVGGTYQQIPIGSGIELSTPISYYYSDTVTESGVKIYNYQFYVYKDINNYNYLYIGPPSSKYDTKTTIKVYNNDGPVYYVSGTLPKFGYKTFTPYTKGLFGVFRINTNDFPKEEWYFFKFLISNAEFNGQLMYYGGSDTYLEDGRKVTLKLNIPPTYTLSSQELVFGLRRIKEKYLYIAPPPPSYVLSTLTKVTVYNTYYSSDIAYTVLGELPKYSNETFSPKQKGKYCAYYIKTEDFSGDSEVYFDVKINNGDFEHEYMFYGGNDNLLNSIILPNNVKRDTAGTTFTVPKTNYKYLYVAPPPPYSYDDYSIISISSEKKSNSNKVAIGVGIGVGAAVLIAIIIIIVVCKKKNGSIESTTIDTSKNDPIHLGATHY